MILLLQYCVFFIQKIQVCDKKNWKTQKNSWKFVRPKKISEILQSPEK